MALGGLNFQQQIPTYLPSEVFFRFAFVWSFPGSGSDSGRPCAVPGEQLLPALQPSCVLPVLPFAEGERNGNPCRLRSLLWHRFRGSLRAEQQLSEHLPISRVGCTPRSVP